MAQVVQLPSSQNASEALSLSTQLMLAQAMRSSRRTTRRMGDPSRMPAHMAKRAFKDATKMLRAAMVQL